MTRSNILFLFSVLTFALCRRRTATVKQYVGRSILSLTAVPRLQNRPATSYTTSTDLFHLFQRVASSQFSDEFFTNQPIQISVLVDITPLFLCL